MTLSSLLVQHTAPTLAGMKCASLVCIERMTEYDMELSALKKKGLSFFLLRNRKGCRLLFVYRKRKLEEAISDRRAKRLLEAKGYDISSVQAALEKLRERFIEDDFPHEVGIFLGYPADDVIGFIENNGRNFMLSGLWKVYSNEERAKNLFMKYEKCKRIYSDCYSKGTTISKLCVATA